MRPTDMRALAPQARLQRRLEVVRLRQAGASYDAIAERTGLSRTGVFDICKRHAAGGDAALVDAPSGRHTGDGRLIDAAQELQIRALIAAHTPDELALPGLLWTPLAVSRLVERQLGLRLPARTLALYLGRWGYAAGRPVSPVGDALPAALRDWLAQTYPAIAARARLEDAELHWVQQRPLLGESSPILPTASAAAASTLIAAMSARGAMHWKVVASASGDVDPEALIRFLRRLVGDSTKKVTLLLDDLPVHRAESVQVWLAEHADLVEIVDIPGPAGLV